MSTENTRQESIASSPPGDAVRPWPLPAGIRERHIDNLHGLRMHVLEAGFERPGRPALLLLHGFPELAYSWRKVMLPLAGAAFHVIAPDQRGYGRTTGWDDRYDGDLASFRMLNLVTDLVGLLSALGIASVSAVAGHDFGSPVAACCALIRPDIFRSVALMSAPYSGPPSLPMPPPPDYLRTLAHFARPRRHYRAYYSTREANDDMRRAPQGLHDFLRAYYHVKSADWPGNRPEELADNSAAEMARLPGYYVMDLDADMPGTVAPHLPPPEQIAGNRWLPDAELAVYAGEFARTGFQGGLQWYRCQTEGTSDADLAVFAGRRIEVPATFIAGRSDWGAHQLPGALRKMQETGCARFHGCHWVDGAGHWVQQEQPAEVTRVLLAFLAGR